MCRYYAAAGAGGIAIGVHTTQFAIRDPKIGLFEPVLALVAEELDRSTAASKRSSPLPLGEAPGGYPGVRAFQAGLANRGLRAARPHPNPLPKGEGTGESREPLVRIAGICGPTQQAVTEAALARGLRYHAGLLSLAALRDADDAALLAHCRAVADVIPLVGFYLQPAVGGRVLSYAFWRRFVEIEAVVAIKIAAFNRYQTLDVVRAVAESGRQDIALYTGNDDHIVLDLLTPYRFQLNGRPVEQRIVGGLLGQWAVWTRRAVELLNQCRAVAESAGPIPRQLAQLSNELTDANAAIFDAANGFAGCIPGIHEILRRQGLLEGNWCLDPEERLSPGQEAEIDRVCRAYPHLTDDQFVAEHLREWLAGSPSPFAGEGQGEGEMIAIRLMTAADIPLGMHLKDQAGWNQTEADWRRLLALDPEGCFVAELDGRAVGTTATTLFGPVGWISMVLVDASVRRLGIGTRLMAHALAYLDRAGAKTVRLDATPLGRPVYEKLGFVADYELARWEGAASGPLPPATITTRIGEVRPAPQGGVPRPVTADSLAAISALDLAATGTQRRPLIERLHKEHCGAFRVSVAGGGAIAYGAWRTGSRAVQVGPLVARRRASAQTIGDTILTRQAGGSRS